VILSPLILIFLCGFFSWNPQEDQEGKMLEGWLSVIVVLLALGVLVNSFDGKKKD
jgi:hypothetical protein